MKTTYAIIFALALAATTTSAFAYDGVITTTGKTSLSFRIENLSSVSGFGAHFSSHSTSDGYGGYEAECHFIAGADNMLWLLCYDGYLDANNAQNQFRVSLGPKSEVSFADVEISARQVTITATRIATNPYTAEKVAYTTTTVMPLRPQSGFWRNSSIYYQTNGVLYGNGGASIGRTGSGYAISALASR